MPEQGTQEDPTQGREHVCGQNGAAPGRKHTYPHTQHQAKQAPMREGRNPHTPHLNLTPHMESTGDGSLVKR